MKFKLRDIISESLCLGCGLCETVSKGNCLMTVDANGFLSPKLKKQFNAHEAAVLNRVCPGINIMCPPKSSIAFGPVKEAVEAYSSNSEIRYRAASGGAVTAICCSMLEGNKVDAILQIGKRDDHHMFNELKISTTYKDIVACASSRYAPTALFSNFLQILRTYPYKSYAFVGKPCDVLTVRRLSMAYPEVGSKIKYLISIACAGIPSFNATQILIDRGGKDKKPIDVNYRGNGWPGKFKVTYRDGSLYECDYNESWGTVLGRSLNFRCKICPDGMGAFADIVVGDSWHTKDGYPDFSESEGKSFILARTEKGVEMVDYALKKSYIFAIPLQIQALSKIHPYQYQRLQTAFFKLLAAWFCTKGLLRIKNLRPSKISIIKGIRIFVGTIKRFK